MCNSFNLDICIIILLVDLVNLQLRSYSLLWITTDQADVFCTHSDQQ